MAPRRAPGSALGIAVMAAASGLLVGGLVTALTRPGELVAWFRALETPEGWSAHPIIIAPILLVALIAGLAGERFLTRLMEPLRRDDEEPIVGDSGPGHFPPGTGWDAIDAREGRDAA